MQKKIDKGSALVFLLFVLMAQVVLPLLGRKEVVPFFDWSLFSTSPVQWVFFDALVEKETGETLVYSSLNTGDPELWQLTQDMGLQVFHQQSPKSLDLYQSQMKKRNLKPVAFLRIKAPLPKYVLMKQEDRAANVETIFNF